MKHRTVVLALIALLFAACVSRQARQPVPELAEGTAPRDIFLPIVAQPIPTSPIPTATPDPIARCFHDAGATAFYWLLIGDGRQQRTQLDCQPALVAAAGWRASGLAAGDPWAHCDDAGVCANEYARQAGCRLPSYYAAKGNNIESLVAGSPDAAIMFAALANSPAHADHLLGRNDFFRAQRHVGIAVAQGGELGWYWVVMIGECQQVSGE